MTRYATGPAISPGPVVPWCASDPVIAAVVADGGANSYLVWTPPLVAPYLRRLDDGAVDNTLGLLSEDERVFAAWKLAFYQLLASRRLAASERTYWQLSYERRSISENL